MFSLQKLEQKLETRVGLLPFVALLILIWTGGYFSIKGVFEQESMRFSVQLYFSRVTLIAALLLIFYSSIKHLKHFFSETVKTATDLAMFRILFFGFFAVGFVFNPSAISDQVIPFLNLPESALVPLPFMSWYPKLIPINLQIVHVLMILFYISIFTSLLGIKTRLSIIIFTLTLFYLFIIPNLYGKVNHNHHLIWFPAILAFSPCADRFSLDAYFRRRSNNVIHHSTKHYSLPFLLIWTIIGLIYFFPGFWKIWTNGLDWCFTNNVRNQMYYKWGSLGNWTPTFRIDYYPLLYKASGMFTILFELLFIPLMVNKATRKWAITSALIFHFGTLLFMNIFFILLVWTYMSFINWNNISFLKERGNMSSLKKSDGSYSVVKWIGIVLISSSLIFGFGKWNSWPFTVYPTFDSIISEERNQLIYVSTSISGASTELSPELLRKEYTSPRYAQIEYNIIEANKNNKLDTAILEQLIHVYTHKIDSVQKIEIYIKNGTIIPAPKGHFEKRLIFTKNLK